MDPVDIEVPPRNGGLATLLALVMACGTIIAPALAVLASFLIVDLGMSRSELGWVIGAYSISAAIVSPQMGVITDRVGGRRAAQGVFLLTALAVLALSMSRTLWTLVGAALAGGIAQSAANPSTNKLIAGRLPAGRRGLVMGIKQSGVQAGVFLTGLVLPPLAIAWGWQAAVAALLTLPVAGLVVTWATLPTTSQIPAPAPVTGRQHLPEAIWWLALYGFLMGLAGGSIGTYLPLFSEEAVGLSVTAAGLAAAVTGASALVARIWFAHLAERTRHFGPPLGVIAIGAVAATVLLIVADGSVSWLLWPAAVMVGLTIGSWNSVAMLAVISTTGLESAGKGSGVVLFGFLLGFGVGPPMFGASVDASTSYGPGLVAALVLFGLAASSSFAWWRRSSP